MGDTTKILVIDDEEAICFAFRRYFERRGCEVAVAATARDGLVQFDRWRPDVVFLDVRLPDADGLDVLDRLRRADPQAAVVVITAYGSLETVTRAIRGKSFDYLVKPLDLDRAAQLVAEVKASRAIAARPGPAQAHAADAPAAGAQGLLVGSSPAIQEVYKRIGKVARADAAVLIHGQTGTGKELVAKAIHHHSLRNSGPFVAVNCAALPDNLVESELFGYVKGAFSGADADKPGRFEAADGGSLLLDEVAELPPPTQVKLLRFLDTQTIERLGSIRSIKLDVRVLAATNRDLRQAVATGAFRADLFYRLAVVQIDLPRLADRGRDVLELAEHFLALRAAGGRAVHLSPQAGQLLCRYAWPGNVRELRNAIEHAAIACAGEVILPQHLPQAVRLGPAGPAAGGNQAARAAGEYLDALAPAGDDRYRAAVAPVERELIRRAMQEAQGNQSAAAKLLGLHRNTLRKRIRELGLTDELAQ